MNSKKRRILIFASLNVFNSLQDSLIDDYELVMQIDSNQALKDLNSYPKCFSLVIVELQSKSEINTDFFNKIKNDVPAIVINKNLNEEAIDECLKIGVSDFIDINENKNLLKNRIINAISLFEERKNSKLNESYIHEIYKNQVLASISKEIQFEYNIVTRELTFSRNGAMKLNLDNICLNPVDYSELSNRCNLDTLNRIKSSINETTIKNPIVSLDIRVNLDKELKWVRLLCRTIFSKNKKEKLLIIGKIADINQELTTIKSLQNKVMLDPLTSILNHKSAKELILQRISDETKEFVLIIFDIDNFKLINDNYGHQFGDQVLQHIGSTLKNCIRTGDIFSRIGGDEFLIFFEGHPKQNETINRIYKSLSETYKNFKISISMGVAETTTCGKIYNDLFNCADKALYEAKRLGKNMIYYYNPSLSNNFSTISNIDTLSEEGNGNHLYLTSSNALHNLLAELEKVFDYVRIIEASEAKVYSLDSKGNLKPCDDNCFSFWNREARCENCISARALANKKRVTKFEYIENNIYEITAIYIEYGSIPLVIEVLSKIDDDSFLNIDTKTDFINTIVRKNNEFYVDFKTSLFNKKYFDEQLKELNDVFGVTLINFESTESFDIIAMTSLIRKHIRRNDIVVSLDYDTALIVLQNITSNRFSSVITNIKNNITNINYISGCYGLSKISFLVNEAMLNSKKSLESHNKIFIEYI